MRGDAATRGKFYNLMLSSGAVNVDEVRALEDMNPVPGGFGKRFWNPLNWGLLNRTPAVAPLGLPSPKPAPADPEDDNEEDGDGDDAPDSEQAVYDNTTQLLIAALVEHGRQRPLERAA